MTRTPDEIRALVDATRRRIAAVTPAFGRCLNGTLYVTREEAYWLVVDVHRLCDAVTELLEERERIDALLPLAKLIADTHSDAGLEARGIEGDALAMARKLRRVG